MSGGSYLLEARYCVHVDQLVGSLFVVMASKVLRLAQHAQPLQVNSFDKVGTFNVQARDDANVQFVVLLETESEEV